MSDKDLDDLFKKASAEQCYPYDSASWPTIAERLETDDKLRTHGRWKNTLLVSSAILFGSMIALFLIKDPKKENPSQSSIITEVSKPLPAAKSDKVVTIVSTNENRIDGSGGLKTMGMGPISNNEPATKKQEKALIGNYLSMDQRVVSNERNLIDESKFREKENHSDETSPDSYRATLVADSLQKESKKESEVIKKNDLDDEGEKEVAQKKGIALKVFLSPDFSSENFSRSDKMGGSFGATVEYYAGNWSVSAGIMRSRKFYTANNVKYGKYTAEFVEGDCRMWDLPMNATYYFPIASSLSIFTSAGVSSYLMSRENYNYYPKASNVYNKYTAEIRGKNNEWFKMLNLSVGLQKQLVNGWGIQVEPFVKVPFSGIGEGNIELASFGMFLSLKYQLKKKPVYVPKN